MYLHQTNLFRMVWRALYGPDAELEVHKPQIMIAMLHPQDAPEQASIHVRQHLFN
jgi:hypothetical protein